MQFTACSKNQVICFFEGHGVVAAWLANEALLDEGKQLIMTALRSRCGHYIFALVFFLLSFLFLG